LAGWEGWVLGLEKGMISLAIGWLMGRVRVVCMLCYAKQVALRERRGEEGLHWKIGEEVASRLWIDEWIGPCTFGLELPHATIIMPVDLGRSGTNWSRKGKRTTNFALGWNLSRPPSHRLPLRCCIASQLNITRILRQDGEPSSIYCILIGWGCHPPRLCYHVTSSFFNFPFPC
jgi:hypothetical protein